MTTRFLDNQAARICLRIILLFCAFPGVKLQCDTRKLTDIANSAVTNLGGLEGAEVIVSCARGYEWNENVEQRQRTFTCASQSWKPSPDGMQCAEITCQGIPVRDQLVAQYGANTNTEQTNYDTIKKVHCKHGNEFKFDGISGDGNAVRLDELILVCNERSQWMATNKPAGSGDIIFDSNNAFSQRCEEKRCPVLPPDYNGQVQGYASNKPCEVGYFYCNSGFNFPRDISTIETVYDLEGSTPRVKVICNPSGKWTYADYNIPSPLDPCQSGVCAHIFTNMVIKNINASTDADYKAGDAIQIDTCTEEYIPLDVEPIIAVCSNSGQWKFHDTNGMLLQLVAQCKEIQCSKATLTRDKNIQSTSPSLVGRNEQITIVCKEHFGFLAPGETGPLGSRSATLICTRNLWTNKENHCQRHTCPGPREANNGYVVSGQKVSYRVGNEITYECRSGYSFANGLSSIKSKCTQRSWVPPLPACQSGINVAAIVAAIIIILLLLLLIAIGIWYYKFIYEGESSTYASEESEPDAIYVEEDQQPDVEVEYVMPSDHPGMVVHQDDILEAPPETPVDMNVQAGSPIFDDDMYMYEDENARRVGGNNDRNIIDDNKIYFHVPEEKGRQDALASIAPIRHSDVKELSSQMDVGAVQDMIASQTQLGDGEEYDGQEYPADVQDDYEGDEDEQPEEEDPNQEYGYSSDEGMQQDGARDEDGNQPTQNEGRNTLKGGGMQYLDDGLVNNEARPSDPGNEGDDGIKNTAWGHDSGFEYTGQNDDDDGWGPGGLDPVGSRSNSRQRAISKYDQSWVNEYSDGL